MRFLALNRNTYNVSVLQRITEDDLITFSQLVKNDSSKDFSKNVALMSILGWKCSDK